MTFKPGDVVTLRSHPQVPMTVERWEGTPPMLMHAGWVCAWFIQGALRRDVFAAEALQPYAPQET